MVSLHLKKTVPSKLSNLKLPENCMKNGKKTGTKKKFTETQ